MDFESFIWAEQTAIVFNLIWECSQLTNSSYQNQSLYLYRLSTQPTPVLLPGKSHGWRSLVGCSPWGHKEWDSTERLHFHFSLSCFGEGNGNPLQCSCLENPRDGGAGWAAVYGVAQSRTWLKRLSSSSSRALTATQYLCRNVNKSSVVRNEFSLVRHI